MIESERLKARRRAKRVAELQRRAKSAGRSFWIGCVCVVVAGFYSGLMGTRREWGWTALFVVLALGAVCWSLWSYESRKDAVRRLENLGESVP